jgi:hypothetical protein
MADAFVGLPVRVTFVDGSTVEGKVSGIDLAGGNLELENGQHTPFFFSGRALRETTAIVKAAGEVSGSFFLSRRIPRSAVQTLDLLSMTPLGIPQGSTAAPKLPSKPPVESSPLPYNDPAIISVRTCSSRLSAPMSLTYVYYIDSQLFITRGESSCYSRRPLFPYRILRRLT